MSLLLSTSLSALPTEKSRSSHQFVSIGLGPRDHVLDLVDRRARLDGLSTNRHTLRLGGVWPREPLFRPPTRPWTRAIQIVRESLDPVERCVALIHTGLHPLTLPAVIRLQALAAHRLLRAATPRRSKRQRENGFDDGPIK